MVSAVDIRGIGKRYGNTTALRNIGLRIAPGELYGLIGADGAGKTTLIKIIVTLCAPDSGTVSVMGNDTVREFRSIRPSLGYMPQRFSLYEDLSVEENISFFADLFGVRGSERRARTERLLAFSRLGPFTSRRARNLSGGMKQKLALCCALVHTPELLVLDEPTTGVDPLSRREFWNILKELNSGGMTIIVSTPYMNEAAWCGNVALLHEGAVIEQGTPSELVARYPRRLYKITSTRGALHVPQSRSSIRGGMVYPVAGALHAALSPDATPDERTILAEIKTLAPSADSIRAVAPGLEDILFDAIAGTRRGSVP